MFLIKYNCSKFLNWDQRDYGFVVIISILARKFIYIIRSNFQNYIAFAQHMPPYILRCKIKKKKNNARAHSFIPKYFINIVTVINLSIISRVAIEHQTFQTKKKLFICLALITQVFSASENCSNYKTRIYYLTLFPVNWFYTQSLLWDLPNAGVSHFFFQ